MYLAFAFHFVLDVFIMWFIGDWGITLPCSVKPGASNWLGTNCFFVVPQTEISSGCFATCSSLLERAFFLLHWRTAVGIAVDFDAS